MLVAEISPLRTTSSHSASSRSTATIGGAQSRLSFRPRAPRPAGACTVAAIRATLRAHPQTSSAVSTTRRSFATCSS